MQLSAERESQFEDLKQQHVRKTQTTKQKRLFRFSVPALFLFHSLLFCLGGGSNPQETLAEKVARMEAKAHRFDANQSGAAAAKAMPTSCQDLSQIGHVLSGLYSVMGAEMVESVYCDFTKLPDDPSKLENKTKKTKNIVK